MSDSGVRVVRNWVRVVPMLLLAGAPSTAMAHAQFVDPPARTGSLNPGPCGDPDAYGERTVFAPGETITLAWEQNVYHGGSYRLAFSPNDDLGFDDNVLAEVAEYDMTYDYEQEVTLPTCECDDCTLQLWQVTGASSGYYSCANIELRSDTAGSVEACALAEPERTPNSDDDPWDDDGASSSGDGDDGVGDDARPADEGDDDGDDASEDAGAAGCRLHASSPGVPAQLALLFLVGLGATRRPRAAHRGRHRHRG